MDSDLATLLAPMGCYTMSHGARSLQYETQSYVCDRRLTSESVERRKLIRSVLSVRRFTPEVESIVRAHLRRFDLSMVWNALTEDRRVAVAREVYDRVHAAASGRANGTAVFATLSNVLTGSEGTL